MKKTILITLIALLSASFAFAQFEGKIVMTMTDPAEGEQIGDVTYYVKNDQVRMIPVLDGNNAKMEIFMDGNTNDMTFTIEKDGETIGMKMNARGNSMMAMQMRMANTSEDVEPPKMTWTGEKKKVNGQNCEKVIVETSDGKVTAWVTKDLGLAFDDLFPIDAPMTSQVKGMLNVSGLEGFPMQIISKSNDGTELVMNCEVTPSSVSNKDMTPRDDVALLDADNLMQEIMSASDDPEKMKEIQGRVEKLMKVFRE